MLLSRANSAPAISFAVPIPSLVVTPTPTRDALQVHGTTAGQSSPLVHSQPRPPRCLTPYPDRSNFPHSLEPSPLSSPAFSAYSLNSGNDDDDVSDVELEVSIKEPLPAEGAREVLSPDAKARADNARLLAPALHMSHLNSPTDQKFREMPLSPMRRLKVQSAASSPAGSPVLLPNLSFEQHDFTDGCFSKMDPSYRGVEVPVNHTVVQHDLDGNYNKRGAAGHMEVKSQVVHVEDVLPLFRREEEDHHSSGVQCGQVLQVHVETVD